MTEASFNSTSETATRLFIALPIINRTVTLDEITAVDLVATYMRFFGYGNHNLHGDSEFVLAEFQARRIRVETGLKRLVRTGYVISNRQATSFIASKTMMEQQGLIRSSFADTYRAAITTLVSRNLIGQAVQKATQVVTQ